ncbi:hypothetical protein [Paraliobacillus sp. X-1268]|uniref:hypothetical protein n=1 Tax=Paraliobacillus sp. X-1268 TaxID=2213193 RepID=UPI000E3CEF94|nr:hypothetical protein [Paraliobacillus sp. X-1268]
MKIIWYLKQLIPLTYRTKYTEDGVKYFTVWKMWLGKCYEVDSYEVKNSNHETIDAMIACIIKKTGKTKEVVKNMSVDDFFEFYRSLENPRKQADLEAIRNSRFYVKESD